MNIKRYLMAVFAVFAFIYFAEWFVHGHWLMDDYVATSNYWRPKAEMHELFAFILVGQLLMAIMFCFIFVKGYENKGLLEGVRFGIYMALFGLSGAMVMYAVQPFPDALVLKWILASFSELAIAGAIAAAVYRN